MFTHTQYAQHLLFILFDPDSSLMLTLVAQATVYAKDLAR